MNKQNNYISECEKLNELKREYKELHDYFKHTSCNEINDIQFERSNLLNVMIQLQENNVKASFINALFEPTIEIINQYAGKPYSPKTKKKIHDQIKKELNVSVWIEQELYGLPKIGITLLNEKGFNCNYQYFKAELEAGYNKKVIDENNKINHLNASDFKCYHCHYITNIEMYAKKILAKKEKIKKLEAALEKELRSYNDSLTYNMQHKKVRL